MRSASVGPRNSTGQRIKASAHRVIHKLEELGLAAETPERGSFTIRSYVLQPYNVWVNLVPSLRALKQARYFGRAYDESDVDCAQTLLKGRVTLDYRACELTGLQAPRIFSRCVPRDTVDPN